MESRSFVLIRLTNYCEWDSFVYIILLTRSSPPLVICLLKMFKSPTLVDTSVWRNMTASRSSHRLLTFMYLVNTNWKLSYLIHLQYVLFWKTPAITCRIRPSYDNKNSAKLCYLEWNGHRTIQERMIWTILMWSVLYFRRHNRFLINVLRSFDSKMTLTCKKIFSGYTYHEATRNITTLPEWDASQSMVIQQHLVRHVSPPIPDTHTHIGVVAIVLLLLIFHSLFSDSQMVCHIFVHWKLLITWKKKLLFCCRYHSSVWEQSVYCPRKQQCFIWAYVQCFG